MLEPVTTGKSLKIVFIISTLTILTTLIFAGTYIPMKPDHTRYAEWYSVIGGPDNDWAYSVIQTSDGGYALLGETWSYGDSFSNMWLVKTNATGQVQWNTTFNARASRNGKTLVQTSDGGFALVGFKRIGGALFENNMWLVKTDANGLHEWNITFSGSITGMDYSLIQTSDEGFALAGNKVYYNGDDYGIDMYLVKTTSTGHILWNRTFGKNIINEVYSLIQTSDGGFALAGKTSPYMFGMDDMWLVKTNTMGYLEWHTTFGGSGSDYAYSVIQTSDGGFALAGYTDSYDRRGDMYLVKTSFNGLLLWDAKFGGSYWDSAYSVIQTSDGGFALAGGTSLSYDGSEKDMWLVKTNEQGIKEWCANFDGKDREEAHSVIQTSDGDYVLVGETDANYVDSDVLLLKLNATWYRG